MRKLWVLGAALVLLIPAVGDGQETVKAFQARVWTDNGEYFFLHDVEGRGVSGSWHYWAPDEEGELSWDLVDYVVFLDNQRPWESVHYREEAVGRLGANRALVYFNSGDVRELWLYVDIIYGNDDWGRRRIYGKHITRLDFLTTYHETVDRCPNGHVWKDPGFSFCPYDGQALVETPQY